MKKTFILVVLFVLPIVAYLFFASGVNNFGRLPILTKSIDDVSSIDNNISLQNKITVLGFLGNDVDLKKGNAFNLNQKIYKRFYEFKDFQFVMIVPKGAESKVAALKIELGSLVDTEKWNFIFSEKKQIKTFFKRLKTDLILDKNLGSPYVFIIDKDKNLRGRTDDEDEGVKYGFDAVSVADLNNKMVDDIKVVLAEYRLALKKNNLDRKP